MTRMERTGTFVGTVVESSFSETKNGFPQWVVRLLANQKYVNEKAEMEHFSITEPAYVEWTEYDEAALGYIILFGINGETLSYEQVKKATGWDGLDFAFFADPKLIGKKLQFRVEQSEYNGKIQFKINWIDIADADPEQQLKQASPDAIKAANAKWLANVKKPVIPAKPAAKPVVAVAAKKSALPPKVADVPAAKPVPAVVAPVPAPAPVVDRCTKAEAWAYVNTPEVKQNNEDDVVADAWNAATSEVGADKEETDFTPEMWATVRKLVAKDLGN